MELPSSSSPSSSSSSTASSDFAPFSSSFSSNDVPAPKMAETSNAADSTLWPALLVKDFIVILLEETSKENVCNGKTGRGYQMAETSNAADSTLWPAPLVKDFIVILLEETSKENVCNGKIGRGCGQAVTNAFNNQTGKNYSYEQINGKLKRLKKQYKLFFEMIRITGMGWNPNTNSEAWINATKLHKKYNEFRNKGLDHCGLLRQLFSTVAQTTSAQQVAQTSFAQTFSTQHFADDVNELGSNPRGNPRGKQPAHTGTSSGKKRKTVSFALESRKRVESAPDPDTSMATATQI